MNIATYTVASNVAFRPEADDHGNMATTIDSSSSSRPGTPTNDSSDNPLKSHLESFAASTSSSKATNPLKSDPELVQLLKKLDTITKYKTFHRWKKSFLERLLPYIVTDPKQRSSLQVADEASDKLEDVLAKALRQAQEVVADKTDDSPNTVKATLALHELGNLLQRTTDTIQEWIPSSTQEEKAQGYTKFHLGAALVQQGFPQYADFIQMEQTLQQIENALPADNGDSDQDDSSIEGENDLLNSTFQAYRTQVERFCDVMTDLGMYEIMKKCLDFAIAPEVEESSDDEGMEIFLEGMSMEGQEECLAMDLEPGETLATSTLWTIESEFGIPPTELILKHKGKELWNRTGDKDRTMYMDFGIRDGDTLKVELRKISLIVHSDYGSNEDEVTLEVTCRNTVQDIKAKVESRIGIPTKQQRLFRHKERTIELSEDDSTVSQYGFDDKEYLVVEPAFLSLHVESPETSQSFDMEVGLEENTAEIKNQIAQETEFSVESFSLLCNKTGEDLPACQTLRDSGLRDRDGLTVKLSLVPITVIRKSDDTVLKELVLHPIESTLGSIKEELCEVSGVASNRQNLYLGQKHLIEDDESVLAMGLKPNDTLFMDEGPVAIISNGDIYMSYTLNVQEAPTDREYKALAKVTKSFYSQHLKAHYPDSFQTLRLACHRSMFQANRPNADYNVYVEWAFLATFEGANSPSRHAMCNYLVKLDLAPYLRKVSKMPQRSFSKTKGVYTQHTDFHEESSD